MSLPAEQFAPVPLSAVLRQGTRDAHAGANSEQFIEELLSGGLTRAAHADLTAQLLPVYEALEQASAALGDDHRGAGLVFTELARVPALERDLGDLSGGQIVKRMMKEHYGLDEEGVAFYTFPDIPKVKVFKDAYRHQLDLLDLDDDEVAATLAETHLAFKLNRAVFTELAAIHC